MNNIDPRIKKVVATAEQVEQRTAELAKWIDEKYKDSVPVCVALLRGAIPFYAKTIMKITIDINTDYIVVTSYGNTVTQMSSPKIVTDLDTDIKGRDVILFDDVLDSGRTAQALIEFLKIRKPRSIAFVVLIDKPYRRAVDFKADWACFTAPDYYVVGCGCDYKDTMRNLNYIGILRTDLFFQNAEEAERAALKKEEERLKSAQEEIVKIKQRLAELEKKKV